jgi:hypothetical protein
VSLSPENRALVEAHGFRVTTDMPTGPATLTVGKLNTLLNAARSHESERVKGLVEALRKSAEGWANAIELGLLPKQHVLAASVLRDEALAALSAIPGEAVLAGEGNSSAGGRVPCPQMDTPTPSPAGGEG